MRRVRWKEQEIDHVDHVKRFNYYSKDIKQISEQKDNLLRNCGALLTLFLVKIGQKG
jgi:hypothetical protein